MTAAHPIPPHMTPERDKRPYEPSMEEILASIRRIIADDQSLPGRQEPAPSVEQPVEDLRLPEAESTTVHVLRPATAAAEVAPAPAPVEHASADAPRDYDTSHAPATPAFVAHGQMAPQYATPEGPIALSGALDAAPVVSEVGFDDHEAQAANEITSDRDARHETFADHHHAYEAELPHLPDVASGYDEPLGRHAPTPFEPAPLGATPLFSAATDQSITAAFNTLAASRLADNSDDLLSMSREMIRPLLKTWLDENLPSLVERLVRAEIERVARGR